MLRTDEGDDLVRDLLLEGRARGIRTSPTVVVGGRALGGAQDPEVIRDFLSARPSPVRPVPSEVQRFRWATSLLEQRDPLGALTMLGPLLEEHGADPALRLLAARAWFASAQLTKARTALEELAAEAPGDSYVQVLLGRTLQRLGLGAEAAPHLNLGAAMTPAYVS